MNRELQAYAGLYLPLGDALRMERMVPALPMSGRIISNGRKGRFQSLEVGLLMDGRMDGIRDGLILNWLTGGITRLQDYTLFFVPWNIHK